MDVHALTVMIGTDRPEALAQFYGSVLGLPRLPEFHDPVFAAGGAKIRILAHSGVRGRNADPARCQVNLFVRDVRSEVARIRAADVPIVREPTVEWWGGVVATIEDPDGNYVQLLQEPPPPPSAAPPARA